MRRVYYLLEDSGTIVKSLPYSVSGCANTAIPIEHAIIILQIEKKMTFFFQNYEKSEALNRRSRLQIFPNKFFLTLDFVFYRTYAAPTAVGCPLFRKNAKVLFLVFVSFVEVFGE